MTHDELLTKIVYKDVWDDELTKFQLRNALRAVVELHHPNPFKRTGNPSEVAGLLCFECSHSKDPEYWVMYPCPTIQAIEKELK